MSTSTAVLRYATGGLGLALIGVGAWRVAAQPDPADVLVWLAGAVVLHDGILAPLVLAVGLLLAGNAKNAGITGRFERAWVRGALLVAGGLIIVTLPLLLRPGAPPNPSALPLPYTRNLLALLAVIAVVTTATILVRRRARPQKPAEDD
ncbi:hypothetical protein AB0M38_32195 [Streptomyces sp. NPDC051742]|uniref:hypothetical protein n=1 Tax=unclassified Streptomyces TaxID=2593676 RepID=UPI00341F2F57